MKLFEDPRYDPIRATILIVIICLSVFFIYKFGFRRELNNAQVYSQQNIIEERNYNNPFDFPSEAGSTTADESLIVPEIVVTPAPTKSIVKKETPSTSPSIPDTTTTTTTTGTLDIDGTNTGGTGTDNITTTGTGGDVTSGNTSSTASGGDTTSTTSTSGGGSGTTVVDPTTTGSEGGYTSGGA